MKWIDPIVDEVHQIRREIMQEHDNDLHKLFESLRERQAKSGRKLVTRSHRSPNHRNAAAR